MIGKGYCRRLITLLSWCKSLNQRIRPSFLGMMKVGEAHSLSCAGMSTPISTRDLTLV